MRCAGWLGQPFRGACAPCPCMLHAHRVVCGRSCESHTHWSPPRTNPTLSSAPKLMQPPPLSLSSSPNAPAASTYHTASPPSLPPQTRRPPPPAISSPHCRHGLFRRHAPPWCEAADQDLDEEEEIRAPQRWIDRCEVTTSSSGRGGAARPEIQAAHASRGGGEACNRGEGHPGRSCSAPVDGIALYGRGVADG